MLSLESSRQLKISSSLFLSDKLSDTYIDYNSVVGNRRVISSVRRTFKTETDFYLDEESSRCLKRMSDAVDTWAEYIRVDPSDLVLDEPYNNVIFQQTVRYL